MAIANAARWSFEKGEMPLLCPSILLHLLCLKGQLFLHSLWFLLYNDILHKEAMPHVGVPRGSLFPEAKYWYGARNISPTGVLSIL